MSRSRSAHIALVAVAALAAAACGSHSYPRVSPAPGLPSQHFVSRPDLRPPIVRIDTAAHDTAPGLIFLAPKMIFTQAGPEIVDNSGHVVWFHPLDTKGVADFKVQRYHGKPVADRVARPGADGRRERVLRDLRHVLPAGRSGTRRGRTHR
jgi:hypothetical protein